MKKKVTDYRYLVIDSCENCYFFDDEYYDYNAVCTKLDRKIKMVECYKKLRGVYWYTAIPDDCPLRKTKESLDY